MKHCKNTLLILAHINLKAVTLDSDTSFQSMNQSVGEEGQ